MAAMVQPAMACGSGDAMLTRDAYATALVEAATDVDRAVAVRPDPIAIADWVTKAGEMASPFPDDDRWFGRRHREKQAREFVQRGAARIAFRSEEKMKGVGAIEFHLYGFWNSPDDPDPPMSVPVDEVTGRRIDRNILVLELWPTGTTSGCAWTIQVREGQEYLIFRDADGRLLGIEDAAGDLASGPIWGLTFEPIGDPADPWLASVRRAAAAR